MEPSRAVVVGAGYLGRFHAEKYAAAEQCELVGVVDVDLVRAQEVAAPLGCKAVADVAELMGEIDCASVVVPTLHHEEVAQVLLRAGVDCLVEKPLAANAASGARLVSLAREKDCILQVGHLERFNPLFKLLIFVCWLPPLIVWSVHTIRIS